MPHSVVSRKFRHVMCFYWRFISLRCSLAAPNGWTTGMSFLQDLQDETVASLPLRDAIVVTPYTLVRAAVAMMRNHSLGCAVIAEHGRRPSGIFTEYSVIDVLNKDANMDCEPVGRYADSNFISVKSTEPVLRVWEAVQGSAARFVCVTDQDGDVIGITGQRGLSEFLADSYSRQVAVQRLGSTPWMNEREGA